MRRQRSMVQMEEWSKTPEGEVNKMGTSGLLDAEFKALAMRMLSELSENFNSIQKGMETIKKTQSEMKDTLTEMKNNLQGINSRGHGAENQISELDGLMAARCERTLG